MSGELLAHSAVVSPVFQCEVCRFAKVAQHLFSDETNVEGFDLGRLELDPPNAHVLVVEGLPCRRVGVCGNTSVNLMERALTEQQHELTVW